MVAINKNDIQDKTRINYNVKNKTRDKIESLCLQANLRPGQLLDLMTAKFILPKEYR